MQTTLDDYRRDVTEYSRRLKVAAAGSDAAAEAVGQARTGYLPRLSLDGNFTATVHHYDGVERWNFSVLPQLVQVVYGGGAVRAAYRQAELGYDIALCDEEFTRLDVRYTAEYTYWNLSAMALYAASMRQYVGIIRSLKEVVDRRFAEDAAAPRVLHGRRSSGSNAGYAIRRARAARRRKRHSNRARARDEAERLRDGPCGSINRRHRGIDTTGRALRHRRRS